jgi:hypothetical protein
MHENLQDSCLSIDRHNSSKLGAYRDHLSSNFNTLGNYMNRVKDQKNEINFLTSTIQELKSRSMSLPQTSSFEAPTHLADVNPYTLLLNVERHRDKLYVPLPVSEREKFTFLQNKVTKLEAENQDLRSKNK